MQSVPTFRPLRKLILYPKLYILHSTHYRLTLLCPFTASSTKVIVHYTQNHKYNTSHFTSKFILTRYLNSCLLHNYTPIVGCHSSLCSVLMRLFSTFMIIPDYLFVFGCECRYLPTTLLYSEYTLELGYFAYCFAIYTGH